MLPSNISKKFMPGDNNLYTDEALYSVTQTEQSQWLATLIHILVPKLNWIVDANASVGGNTWSFSKHAKKVTAIELQKKHYDMLIHNMKSYNNIEFLNMNCVEFLMNMKNIPDVVFLDPPWGGINYKDQKTVKLGYSYESKDVPLNTVIRYCNKVQLVVLKLPRNYDIQSLEEVKRQISVVDVKDNNNKILYKIVFISDIKLPRIEVPKFERISYREYLGKK